ncbi:hypothetical protein GGQ74_001253 [Desulfobaculum xiamenense]|uniref:Uncharacterized protein n=1 Tax=Desulfobaculum xiamenense TaxID=995050 RepID=A0A846QMY4_9BACT|nr:hypothetical protein [Desulfobaculum xiamenense]NJB67613.1 hypothetical protein [Desulfobaculum xiamenense]
MWESLPRGMQIIVITALFSVIALVGGALIVRRHNRDHSERDGE